MSRPNLVARAAGEAPIPSAFPRHTIAPGRLAMPENIHWPGTLSLSNVPEPFRGHIRAAYERIRERVSQSRRAYTIRR